MDIQHCNMDDNTSKPEALSECAAPCGNMWRPFFDIEHLQRFADEITDHPQGAGRGGLCCPKELSEKARLEYNYFLKDGKTTGNCCVQSFTESAIEQNVRPIWKKMNEQKRCQDARKLACDWASKNKEKTFWGGCSFREVAEIVSHQSFEKWIGRLRLTDTWADVAFLQAMACSVGADVLLVDDSPEASKLLGVSLMEGDHGCSALVPMAMWKHFHFWPLIPLESCALEQVSLHVSPGAELRLESDPDFDTLQASELAIGGREQELQLCEALVEWAPFELPTPKLVDCLQSLAWLNDILESDVRLYLNLNLNVTLIFVCT